jgi:dTDP-4-dehydrorhamnose reductase
MGIYAKSKRWAEEVIKDHTAPWLILRTSFKPVPFPFEFAYEDQYTQGDGVDIIAKLLAERIKTWKFDSGVEYLGTGRKTMFELAQKTRPDVKPNKVEDYVKATGTPIPYDYQD